MKYGNITLGQIEAIVNKLGGVSGVTNLLSGATVVVKKDVEILGRCYRDMQEDTVKVPRSVWTQVTLGMCATVDEYRHKISTCELPQRMIWGNTQHVIEGIAISPEEVRLDLMHMKVRDLGFPCGASSLEVIYEMAEHLGLELCPPEVGLALCLQYPEPLGETLFLATKGIYVNRDFHYLFVGRPEDKDVSLGDWWKNSTPGGHHFFGPEAAFIFVLPKKK